MLYLAIDQHAKQLTVNLRDEQGTVLLRRQVSTQPARVREFFAELREQSTPAGGYRAILEVWGAGRGRCREGCREGTAIFRRHLIISQTACLTTADTPVH